MVKHTTDKEINTRVKQVTQIDILQRVHVRHPFRVWMLVPSSIALFVFVLGNIFGR